MPEIPDDTKLWCVRVSPHNTPLDPVSFLCWDREQVMVWRTEQEAQAEATRYERMFRGSKYEVKRVDLR